MGRRKIEILPIQNERNRSVTFLKRKTGLFKKAYELGVLCSVDVAVIIFERRHGHPDKLYQYCSTDIGSIVQRHIRFDGERDTRTPHDFSGGTDASRVDDVGDDDDDADADDPAPPQRKRQDSSSAAAGGPSAKGKKADGGKMVPIKPESMTIDVDYRPPPSHLSMPPSASPTLPISSDRHTSATHSPTRAHPSSSSSSSVGAGAYSLSSNKRARLAPASELDRHPSLHASSPGGAHTPFPYRLDLDAASAHPSLHAHTLPLPPHVHTAPPHSNPYASFFPPSTHTAHGAPFLNPSASFARASLSAPYSHPPPQSLSHSQQQQQQQLGMYGAGSMLRAPQQQPLPRISQPPTPHQHQHHQHQHQHQQQSPDDLFAGVFGPPSSSSGSGSTGGSSSTVGSGGMFGGGGGGMMMGGGVGGVETFFGIPLTFDWPQLSQPPPHRQSTDSGTSGDDGGGGSGGGGGGQTWLDFLSGTAPAPPGEGLLGSVGAESGGGGGARGGKRGRGDGEGKGEDEGRRGGDGDVSLEDIVGGGGGGDGVDRGA